LKGEIGHGWPEFLPDGKAVLFGILGPSSSQVAIQSVGTGERRNLIPGGTQPRYALSGHLVYAQGGNLLAVPFDPQRLTVTGATVPVVEGVVQTPTRARGAQYSLSATGSLVYVSGAAQTASRMLVWVDRKGMEQPLHAPLRAYRYPRLSPNDNGQRVAVTIEDSDVNISLYDLARDTLTPLTFQGGSNLMGAWTPDGKRITFGSVKEGLANAFWQLADGSGGLEQLTSSESSATPSSWSPDGQLLTFHEFHPITGGDIWVWNLRDHKVQPFLQGQSNEVASQFSPDGHWLAYVSDASGRLEIYVKPYPGPGAERKISTDGGTEPVWNRNGPELFYRSGNKMMAVNIVMQSGFTAGNPHTLFEGPYLPTSGSLPNYDVSPDGERFLMVKPTEQRQVAPTQINVVLNWFEELKQKVPVGSKR
jgi:Tol biopolymer transport system component